MDLGNLLTVDVNPLDSHEIRSNRDAYLMSCARDDVQLLINDLWKLPVEVSDNVHVVKLPASKTVIPREKPVPAPKKATKWEEYARVKGITKKKRTRMLWDEQAKEWRPRWGYQRANDPTKDWLIEVPNQSDPLEDQFAKRIKAKKEAAAKNELQRLRNIARNMKGKVPGVGLTPLEKPDKDDISKALSLARTSTASIGKFTDALPKEKPEKRGKKRKFEPNYASLGGEKKRSLDILNRLQTQQPLLDIDKSANRLMAAEQRKRADTRQSSFDEPTENRKKKAGKRSVNGGGKKGRKGGGAGGSKLRGHKGGKRSKTGGKKR